MNEHAKSLLGSASVDPDKVETVSHVDAMPQAAQDGGLGTQAREKALGNLLAVIHGDGGHRALEVGVEQAAAEAEKIVSGLFAAPSADKLRIAVEALDEAHENLIQCGDHFGAGQCADAVSLISTPDALKGDAKDE